jgi:hypothetical protein
MATDGGGGGYSSDPGASRAGGGGSEGGRFVRTQSDAKDMVREQSGGDLDLGMDGEVEPQLVPAPGPPRPASVKTWTSGGRTSCDDPMTHYLYNGDG